MTFEELMEREERQALLGRLRHEYPQWKRRRRATLTAMASLTVLVAVAAGITLSTLHSTLSTYDSVACNRSGIADSHWATMAGNILTIDQI